MSRLLSEARAGLSSCASSGVVESVVEAKGNSANHQRTLLCLHSDSDSFLFTNHKPPPPPIVFQAARSLCFYSIYPITNSCRHATLVKTILKHQVATRTSTTSRKTKIHSLYGCSQLLRKHTKHHNRPSTIIRLINRKRRRVVQSKSRSIECTRHLL